MNTITSLSGQENDRKEEKQDGRCTYFAGNSIVEE